MEFNINSLNKVVDKISKNIPTSNMITDVIWLLIKAEDITIQFNETFSKGQNWSNV